MTVSEVVVLQANVAVLVSCLIMMPAAASTRHPGSISWQVPASAVSAVAAPDAAGGFVLRVATTGTTVRADHCSVPGFVELQMPDTMPTGAAIDLDAAQRADAERKISFYRKIMTNRGTINFRLVESQRYLFRRSGELILPHCVALLDWTP
ncbi:MAG: hypothetical protein ACYCZB_04870 [Acidiphilium sp.]